MGTEDIQFNSSMLLKKLLWSFCRPLMVPLDLRLCKKVILPSQLLGEVSLAYASHHNRDQASSANPIKPKSYRSLLGIY